MERNLAAIEKRAAKSGANTRADPTIEKTRRRIERQMEAEGCNAPSQKASSGSKGLFSALFPGVREGQDSSGGMRVTAGQESTSARSGAYDANRSRARMETTRTTRPSFSSSRTYRTLCVRTCDGYFFPLSFKTSPRQFAQEAQRCGEICPNAQTELYVYRNPGSAPENMMSLAGQPYDALENAWRYRNERVQGCSCKAAPEPEQADGQTLGKMRVLKSTSGRIKVIIAPNGEDEEASSSRPLQPLTGENALVAAWSRPPEDPLLQSPDADPVTRMDRILGFDLDKAIRHAKQGADAFETGRGVEGGMAGEKSVKGNTLPTLPRLGRAAPARGASNEQGAEAQASGQHKDFEAVFTAPDATQATSSEEGQIRVVGPEYFVAQ